MDSDGANTRKLTDADAGHGYAANWSPDGKQIALVVRENTGDETADQSGDALISNIYVNDVASGALTQITKLIEGRTETPHWSPDGNILAFNLVINGRMEVHIADIESVGVGFPTLLSAEVKPLVIDSACCPAWMRK
jgi:Tol biopolymer transport system component